MIVRHYKPALKQAKLSEDLRVYNLRLSCATMLFEQGEHPRL
jgi:hypothetical protein